MNYSRNIKKASIAKRFLISCVVVAILFSLAGFGIGRISKSDTASDSNQKEVVIFGQPDGKMFEAELPVNWENKLTFTPLDVPMNEELQEFVFYLSAAYDIDFTFAMAVIQHESNFQADVISATDDYGLMQINVQNHTYLKEKLGISDFLNPYDNIRAGMFTLRNLFEKYETPEKVLMAYNMGETGASRLWEQGIFEINYSKSILQIQQKMNAELEGSATND